jgi:nucleoside-diphosphate-sugar epimerase
MANLIIGCGYIGQRIAKRWLSMGARVFATTRSKARADEFRRQGIDPIICDVLHPGTLKDLPAISTVLYAIGLDRSSGQTMREVYVQGLTNVLTALPSPRCLLYISSTSVYGQRHGEAVDEQAVTEPVDPSGQVVLEAEQILRLHAPRAVVLRFAGIYGPGRLTRQQALLKGEPLVGNPDQWLNLIHAADGVAAVLAAEARGRPGEVYNVSDGRPVRRRDFYEYLAQLLKSPPPCFEPSAPGRSDANRRVTNRRLCVDLALTFQYPSYLQGLPASLDEENEINGGSMKAIS